MLNRSCLSLRSRLLALVLGHGHSVLWRCGSARGAGRAVRAGLGLLTGHLVCLLLLLLLLGLRLQGLLSRAWRAGCN